MNHIDATEPYSLLVNYSALSDDPLRFRKNLWE